jgi:hypothetical protein
MSGAGVRDNDVAGEPSDQSIRHANKAQGLPSLGFAFWFD